MYQVLREITEWETNTPNHTYVLGVNGKCIAYQIDHTGPVIELKRPLSFTKTRRKFVTKKFDDYLNYFK